MGILVRKSHCMIFKPCIKVRNLSNISDGAFVQKQSTAMSCYPFLQKPPSQMFGQVLHTPLMMNVAKYRESVSNKTEILFSVLAKRAQSILTLDNGSIYKIDDGPNEKNISVLEKSGFIQIRVCRRDITHSIPMHPFISMFSLAHQ